MENLKTLTKKFNLSEEAVRLIKEYNHGQADTMAKEDRNERIEGWFSIQYSNFYDYYFC